MTDPTTIYTAISFAPVQGFIEKSRKLRDLFGASLILSYLSQKIVEKAEALGKDRVISPGLIDHQEGMPNRILVKGELTREIVENTLLGEWQRILRICRKWVEDNIGIPKNEYHWSGEWERWGKYTWEIFMGWGKPDPQEPKKNLILIQAAMDDLETRKLKRDWTAVNWTGESSSLSGTDAIAWPRLGQDLDPNTLLNKEEKRHLSIGEQQQLTETRKKQFKDEQELFYRRLSWVLDAPEQRKPKSDDMVPARKLSLEELRAYEKDNPEGIGRYIAVNERLSIPELVKRLITYDEIDEKEPENQKLKIAKLKKRKDDPEFKDIYREAGYWTGWFMGDGDRVGDKLKQLAEANVGNLQKQEKELLQFSELMRGWGRDFEDRKDLFPGGKGRVIYAGGDDFMGVLYSEETQTKEKPEKLKAIEAWDWLLNLPKQWEKLQNDLANELSFSDENRFTYSVGFVWAGHSVPQRDVLQHCREAEKRSKSLGRDRVTIRVLFNSGQYVQWTCPWDYLDILTKYSDRNGINTQREIEKDSPKRANWAHIYNDWATLKARHAIQLTETDKQNGDSYLALQILNLYFDNAGEKIKKNPPDKRWKYVAGDNSELAIVKWIDSLIQVGWHLCSNI